MQSAESKMAEYINQRGLKIKYVSEVSGVPYYLLQPALKGKRKMQIDEFLNICNALGADPEQFRPQEQTA